MSTPLTPDQISQQELACCLPQGELIYAMDKLCPPEIYWLAEWLFPRGNVRYSANGQFNLINIMQQAVGPATFSSLCKPQATVVTTGETLQLDQVQAPLIYEKTPMDVCSTDDYRVHPKTGMPFPETEAGWREKIQYVQAQRGSTLVQRIRKRMELMAAEILTSGTVTIDGPNIQKTMIEYGRDPNNTVVVDPADRWCADTSMPLDMLDDVISQLFCCEGDGTTDVLMSTKVYKMLRNHKQIQDMLTADSASCQGCLLDMEQYPYGTKCIGQRYVGA